MANLRASLVGSVQVISLLVATMDEMVALVEILEGLRPGQDEQEFQQEEMVTISKLACPTLELETRWIISTVEGGLLLAQRIAAKRVAKDFTIGC
jgi:hypothetical protein